MAERKTFLFILGAGASKSCGLPMASEIPEEMIRMASDESLGASSRETLRVVGNALVEYGCNTVDELAVFVQENYENGAAGRNLHYTLIYLAQWATCVLLRHKQNQLAIKNLSSYRTFFNEIRNRANEGLASHILSFNYDDMLCRAYQEFYHHSHTTELDHISGGRDLKIGENDRGEVLGFRYSKLHGSVNFIVPLTSQGNPREAEVLSEEKIENCCTEILSLYKSSAGEGSDHSRFSVPMVTFPMHQMLFKKAENLTRVFRKQIDTSLTNAHKALESAVGIKAIGYSFPEADRPDWTPVLQRIWEQKVPLLVQAGEKSTLSIVEKLRFEIRMWDSGASESKLEELLRPLPINF